MNRVSVCLVEQATPSFRGGGVVSYDVQYETWSL